MNNTYALVRYFKSSSLYTLLALSLITATGCVTGNRGVVIPVESGDRPVLRKSAAIRSVVDLRTFVDDSSDPSDPSASGGVQKLSRLRKSQLVGRQRNAYGGAMGNVELYDEKSIQELMRSIVAEGLARRGVAVRQGATPIDIRIDKFWGWMNPGMMTLSIETEIQARVTINNRTRLIRGHGIKDSGATFTFTWEEAYRRAVIDFLDNLDWHLQSSGL